MDQARAREILSAQVRERFGKVVDLREVSVVRRASGRAWVGGLYCVTRGGELRVGSLEIDEDGRPCGSFGVDELVAALQGAARPPEESASVEDAASVFAFDLDETPATPPKGDDLDGFFGALEQPDLRSRIDWLLSSSRREDLVEARRLLPRLLARPDTRASILSEMGELEVRLGQDLLALNYLEAAAREFADAGDVAALARVCERAEAVPGPEGEIPRGAVRAVLERSRARLAPIGSLAQARSLAGLGPEETAALERAATLVSARAGQDVLVEGAPARHLLVVKTGRLSIRLETPDGGSRSVRCCFPGDLVGESSVLKQGASCTATVRAECDSVLWRFEGAALRKLGEALPAIRAHVEAAGSRHQLDSFFSMNEASLSLDARVRDGLLGCVAAIRRVVAGEVLAVSGAAPSEVFLVVEGALEWRAGGESRRHGRDSFVLLHDAIHDVPLDGQLVAAEPASVVCFDAPRLRALAADAPPDVVRALERLAG